MIRKRRPRLAAARRARLTARGKPFFFKSVLGFDVAFRMKRTRHQLAPTVPAEKIINRAAAGFVADRPFVSLLEIVDVQHLAGPGGVGKPRQQHFLLGERHVLALPSAGWPRLERFDAALIVGHVRPVHRAQRNPHRLGDRRLRHAALAK
jgi:hypothetical protein